MWYCLGDWLEVLTFSVDIVRLQEINLDYLVPEIQSYHFDMGSLSGKGEVDPADHFRQLYGGAAEVTLRVASMGIRVSTEASMVSMAVSDTRKWNVRIVDSIMFNP